MRRQISQQRKKKPIMNSKMSRLGASKLPQDYTDWMGMRSRIK